MDFVPDIPFSVIVSSFGHRSVHIPKHTVVGLALPSSNHILPLVELAAEAVEGKEGGGIFNSNLSTAPVVAGGVAGEAADNPTEKGGAEQAALPRATLRADGPGETEETAAPRGDANAWQDYFHIGSENEEIR